MSIKLDKALLAKVARMAKVSYRDATPCDGVEYLESDEVVAKAWILGFMDVLASKGYEIVQKTSTKD